MVPVVLASGSPQRKTLLEGLGLRFSVEPSAVEESACAEPHPRRRANILSQLKARDVASRHPDSIVIGCDTLVVDQDGTLLEKPRDAKDAERMLRLQSDRISVVHSGLTIIAPGGKEASDVSSNYVHFAALTERDIQWWVDSALWKDRSGAFQIDGLGQFMIKKIEGDWTGIVGLPVFLLGELLRKSGVDTTSLSKRY